MREEAERLEVVDGRVDPGEPDPEQHVDAERAEDRLHADDFVADDPREDHERSDQHQDEHQVAGAVVAFASDDRLHEGRELDDEDDRDAEPKRPGAHVRRVQGEQHDEPERVVMNSRSHGDRSSSAIST